MEESLKDKLFNQRKNGWSKVSEEEKKAIFSFSEEYISFMNQSKTEREVIESSVKMVEEKGFRDINQVETLNPGGQRSAGLQRR